MKKISIKTRRIGLASSFIIVIIAGASLITFRTATTQSKAIRSAAKDLILEPAVPVQSQTSTLYLHGTGPVDNPPTVFLDATAPTSTNAKDKDSPSITRTGGNPWKEVGTWAATPPLTSGNVVSLSDLHAWLGLKNSDDQGTNFDLRVEAYRNGSLLTSGQTLCVTGVTRNASSAKEVVVSFNSFSAIAFNGTSDALSLKILTRVGTDASGNSCGGHSNAVGLRLYFDAVSRPSRFSATQVGDTTAPVVTVATPAENSVTAATQVNVTGTFSDQSPTTIVVNGVTSTLQGNNFSATVPVTEGSNSLLITATDSAGNATAVTRHVVRDTTPPAIAIQQPTTNTVTNSNQITVSGTINDATATTVKVNNVIATLAGNTFSATVPLLEGVNALNVVAVDAAGNQSTASPSVTRDTIPPTIAISQPAEGAFTNLPQVTVTGTFSDATSTTIQVNNVAAVLNGNNYSATVTLNEGPNTITVVATDAVQHTTQIARNLARDSTPPTIVVESPIDGSATNHNQVEVRGVFDDATATSIMVENVAAILNGNDFTASLTLAEGANSIHLRATDAAGNQTDTSVSITFDTTPPTLLVAAPANNTTTNNKILSVSGSSSDATAVTITANQQTLTTAANGAFSDLVVLNEGNNEITFVAKDAAGNQSQSIVRSVVLDSEPPQISQLTPAQNAIIGSNTTTIQAHVADATVTVVKVNDIVVNTDAGGNFTAANVAIVEGQNRFTINATDRAGNSNTTTLVLIGGDVTAPAAPQLFATNALTRLAFQTIEGRAEPNAQVVISGGVEPVTIPASEGTGLFVANVVLVSGANQLSVTATDAAGNVSAATQVSVTSNPNLVPPPGQVFQINSSSGNAQHGLIGAELPRPVIALVTDQTGAPVSGVNIHFTVVEGGGHFVTGVTSDGVSDAQGHASVRYFSGNSPGVQIIRGNFDGNTSTPAVFSAEAFAPTNGATTVSGIVLDQDLRALPNVLVRISGQQTRTAIDGRFKVLNVPAGPHQLLELIGRDQVSLPGRWPNITYDFDVLAGVANDLGRPLFLPRVNEGISLPLDSNNVVTQDTTVEVAVGDGVPPIQVTALAGTHVSFPPDVTDKRLSVTRIATNRVPMVLEEGRATNLYISVQPSGALFDQPLRISFPNLDEQPANSAVLLMSFDHDAGRYVQVGTGHVTADGRLVISDSGSGIRVGAWHALPPPPPRPEVTVLGHIQIRDNRIFDKRSISEAEAWVEGVSAILVSSPDADDRLDFRATYSLAPGSAPKLARMESTVAADEFDTSIEVKVFNPDGSPVSRVNSTSVGRSLLALTMPPAKTKVGGPSGSEPVSDEAAFLAPEQPNQEPTVAYGGSKDELSDQFDVIVDTKDQPGAPATAPPLEKTKSITWSVSGLGGSSYKLPDPADRVTKIHVFAQLPAGHQIFKAVVRYKRGGGQILTKDVDIGVRTDDLIAVGWIDVDNVPLSDAGVGVRLSTSDMPVGGSPVSFLDRFRCNQDVAHLTINDLDYFSGDGLFAPLNPAERIYMLNWMFKYAGSKSPVSLTGGDFQGSDGRVSKEKIDSYIANHTSSYKVFNQLQIKYRVTADEAYNGTPTIENSANALGARTVGITRNPCGPLAGFLQTFDTQQGYADMKTINQTDNFGQINDGSPGAAAIRAFNTLTGKDLDPGQTPKFWEDVGSQIAFPVTFGQVGKFIWQPYPTFYFYRNGKLLDVKPQAANPIDHFYPNPYPFGDVPCTQLTRTTPGGRCGDAQSAPAPGSRVPPFVQDLLRPPF